MESSLSQVNGIKFFGTFFRDLEGPIHGTKLHRTPEPEDGGPGERAPASRGLMNTNSRSLRDSDLW